MAVAEAARIVHVAVQRQRAIIGKQNHLLLSAGALVEAVVIGSPVYMGQMTGQTKTFLDRLLPLLNADFSTRLKKRPALVLVFTQGQPDTSMFLPYMENTKQMFGFLGFTAKEIIVAGGTREQADVDKQTELTAKARSLGAGLFSGSK